MNIIDGHSDKKVIIIKYAVIEIRAKYELCEEKLCKEHIYGEEEGY